MSRRKEYYDMQVKEFCVNQRVSSELADVIGYTKLLLLSNQKEVSEELFELAKKVTVSQLKAYLKTGDVFRISLDKPFVVYPFSCLNTRHKEWQWRKKLWEDWGVHESGKRASSLRGISPTLEHYFSVFDPVLCELVYGWYGKRQVFDPFCGGAVRGMVATKCGLLYRGIDISEVQIESNREKSSMPLWEVGDAVSWKMPDKVDLVFTCPPYWNMEVYSSNPADLSTMSKEDFLITYERVIRNFQVWLSSGGYVCIVVQNMAKLQLVQITHNLLAKGGFEYVTEFVILNVVGSRSLRLANFEKTRRAINVHQNLLVYQKV